MVVSVSMYIGLLISCHLPRPPTHTKKNPRSLHYRIKKLMTMHKALHPKDYTGRFEPAQNESKSQSRKEKVEKRKMTHEIWETNKKTNCSWKLIDMAAQRTSEKRNVLHQHCSLERIRQYKLYQREEWQNPEQNSKCRLRERESETVTHIISECNKLAWNEFKRNHARVGTVIRRELSNWFGFDHVDKKY